MPRAPKSTIDISAGTDEPGTFILFLRNRPGRQSAWSCRLRLDRSDTTETRYLTRALATSDVHVARKLAHAWRNTEVNLQPLFSTVALSWLEHVQDQARRARELGQRATSPDQLRRWETSVRRYLIPFFGANPIDKIDSAIVAGYGHWRANYYNKADPAALTVTYNRGGKIITRRQRGGGAIPRSTVSKDVEAFNKIITFATKTLPGVKIAFKPTIQIGKEEARQGERRANFKSTHIQAIWDAADRRVNAIQHAVENRADPSGSWLARQKQQRHARIVIRAVTQFMWLTGVRTAEAVRLTARSIRYIPVRHGPGGAAKEIPLHSRFDYRIDGSWIDRSAHEQTTLDAEYVVVVPPVKHRSHGREAIPREEFLYWVTSHGQYLSSVFGGKPHNYFNVFDTLSEDLPLFPGLDGRVLADLGKHHDRLLDDALSKQFDEGLLHIDGKRMSLSSWRHTYVTEMLSILAKKKTPNLVSFLAKNIGSSEAMIEKHYGHLIPEMARDELRV